MPHKGSAIWGWTSFAPSGVFFLISAIRSGDVWSLMGSVVRLIGIGFFVSGYRAG